MKAFGVKKKDLSRDCTATGKYGSCKIVDKCACGATKAKKSKDCKARKAKERQKTIKTDE